MTNDHCAGAEQTRVMSREQSTDFH